MATAVTLTLFGPLLRRSVDDLRAPDRCPSRGEPGRF
jgi:hypothetical protein